MYNSPFYMSGFNPTMMNPSMLRNIPTNSLISTTRGLNTTNTLANIGKSTGLLSRLGTGLSSVKKINWGGLINNTSKTLGIINQTIPLVKQVGPIVGNIRSMMRVASIFKDETDTPKNSNYFTPPTNSSLNNNTTTTTIKPISTIQNKNTLEKTNYTESPTFFINT